VHQNEQWIQVYERLAGLATFRSGSYLPVWRMLAHYPTLYYSEHELLNTRLARAS
jgi:hypothetical protein